MGTTEPAHAACQPMSPVACAASLVHLLIESLPPPETAFSGARFWNGNPNMQMNPGQPVHCHRFQLPFAEAASGLTKPQGFKCSLPICGCAFEGEGYFVITSVVRERSHNTNCSGVFLDIEPTFTPHKCLHIALSLHSWEN